MFTKTIIKLKQYLLESHSAFALFATILFWKHSKLVNFGRSTMTVVYKSTIKLELRYPPHSDFQVFKQIFIEREYEDVIRLFCQYFQADSDLIVVDAGSNIGLAALFLFDEMSVKRVICIEPDNDNFKTLSTNMKKNHSPGAYELVNQAILGTTGLDYKLEKDFRDKKDWSIRVSVTDSISDQKSITIGDLMLSKSIMAIDILKIDVEGSERSLFAAKADYAYLQATKMVVIEIHEDIIEPKEIIEVFRRSNYLEVKAKNLYYFINNNFIKG